MLRAAFLLLAIILLVMVGETLLALIGCTYMVLSGRSEPGTCMDIGIVAQVREVLSEALTAVLALLLAARDRPPPDG
jgi:hypothetical protein